MQRVLQNKNLVGKKCGYFSESRLMKCALAWQPFDKAVVFDGIKLALIYRKLIEVRSQGRG